MTALVLLLIATTAAAGSGWWQLNKARSTILMNQSDNLWGQDQTITGEIYSLQGVRLNTIGRDRFVTYLPDGAYLLSVFESQGRERTDTLHLRDRYGNVVVSLGPIKGEIGETKMSADAKRIAVRTHDKNLVLRCTPEGIVDEPAQTQRYTPDTLDRLKHGID